MFFISSFQPVMVDIVGGSQANMQPKKNTSKLKRCNKGYRSNRKQKTICM